MQILKNDEEMVVLIVRVGASYVVVGIVGYPFFLYFMLLNYTFWFLSYHFFYYKTMSCDMLDKTMHMTVKWQWNISFVFEQYLSLQLGSLLLKMRSVGLSLALQ